MHLRIIPSKKGRLVLNTDSHPSLMMLNRRGKLILFISCKKSNPVNSIGQNRSSFIPIVKSCLVIYRITHILSMDVHTVIIPTCH